jgi:hypothetical protein
MKAVVYESQGADWSYTLLFQRITPQFRTADGNCFRFTESDEPEVETSLWGD